MGTVPSSKKMEITIVVPCYNEEAVLQECAARLSTVGEKLRAQGDHTRLLFVDDGSKDRTWTLIEQLAAADKDISGLKLAHNVGHQRALWAGLEWAATHTDAAVSIDADLQDDESTIEEMVRLMHAGNDIVYGVRRERKTDTWFKRNSALLFYRLLNGLGGDVLHNHADFRLMTARALRGLMDFPERNLFLRGMVYSLGFPHATVYYDRKERFAGESKYPLRKMLGFALDGITSFSFRPLRLIFSLGLLFILISLGAIVYGLAAYANGRALPGWTSLIVSVWFIGGAILTAMGIIGEYVGKIYAEVKRRPRYLVEKSVNLP